MVAFKSLGMIPMVACIGMGIVFHQQANGQEQTRSVKPLSHAHAHNDYEHARPLYDALDEGFNSVEADVYLVDGELLVAHDFWNVSKKRTLERLYLIPLQERIQANKGHVFPGGPAFTLLVDIKRDGASAYVALEKLLAGYSEFISQTLDGKDTEKAVTVIISGDRPKSFIAASNPRYAGIDGRLSDLDSDEPASLLPLISDNWSLHFRYRGDGEMSETDRTKLREIVAKAHSKGRRVRFWATPESDSIWKELQSAQVDLIGTDNLKKLSGFLNAP
ncbi:MAG: phosphatidylinositol-specific phospholipase C/glycerophosphodiester phosphodiesterase family protein [Planctomycetota bacterium]|nr:phosphatidylinositol-specific phospholipase C/glycerophosphodiester phosphodiesterase family protein [Planctomycetota bacterium]